MFSFNEVRCRAPLECESLLSSSAPSSWTRQAAICLRHCSAQRRPMIRLSSCCAPRMRRCCSGPAKLSADCAWQKRTRRARGFAAKKKRSSQQVHGCQWCAPACQTCLLVLTPGPNQVPAAVCTAPVDEDEDIFGDVGRAYVCEPKKPRRAAAAPGSYFGGQAPLAAAEGTPLFWRRHVLETDVARVPQ